MQTTHQPRTETSWRPAGPSPPTPEAPAQGSRLRAARAAADLSREELAEAIGCSARTIRRLEDGQRRVTAEERRRIAQACRAPEWFLQYGWDGWERVHGR